MPCLLAIALCSAAALCAQVFNVGFEVASVKPSASDSRGNRSMQTSRTGRFTTTNASLRSLISMAWNVRSYQIKGGPAWIDADGWDIAARPPEEIGPHVDDDQMRRLIQSLLEDRFHLQLRRESRESPVYFLVVGPNGPKVKPSVSEAKGSGISSGTGQMRANHIPLRFAAETFSDIAGRPVLDRTGLDGPYDFELKWTPDMTSDPDSKAAPEIEGPSFFTAVEEQLGLKLQPGKGPVDVLLIEHVEKPSEN